MTDTFKRVQAVKLGGPSPLEAQEPFSRIRFRDLKKGTAITLSIT